MYVCCHPKRSYFLSEDLMWKSMILCSVLSIKDGRLIGLNTTSNISKSTIRHRQISLWSNNVIGHFLDLLPENKGNMDYSLTEPLFGKKYHTRAFGRSDWNNRTPNNFRYVQFYTDYSKLTRTIHCEKASRSLQRVVRYNIFWGKSRVKSN